MWASLPCGPWSQWQYLNAHRYGAEFRKKLAKSRDLSLKLLDRFCALARCVVEHGGDVHFEWPRHALGWKQAALCQLIRDIGMTVMNFDGCAVGLVDRQGTPLLKKWRVATASENLAKNLNECRCKHGTDFKHAPITGSNTSTTARYPEITCEIVFSSLFPGLVFKEVPAMPVCEAAVCVVAQEHVEKEPKEQVYRGPLFIETVDTFATPAELKDDLAPADDEAEPAESRDARLKREAKSLEHITTHAKKDPFREHCVRGLVLKREVRALKKQCKPIHLQAGFSKKMWPISVVYTAESRAFGSPCVIREHERGTEIEELKTGKTRWEVCTSEPFFGIKYPLGALVFYRAKSDGMAQAYLQDGVLTQACDTATSCKLLTMKLSAQKRICIGVPRICMRRRCFPRLLST